MAQLRMVCYSRDVKADGNYTVLLEIWDEETVSILPFSLTTFRFICSRSCTDVFIEIPSHRNSIVNEWYVYISCDTANRLS